MKTSKTTTACWTQTKVTILIAGRECAGVVREWVFPQLLLTEFLDARRVEIARPGDYTVLVLFSVGTELRVSGAARLKISSSSRRLYDTKQR